VPSPVALRIRLFHATVTRGAGRREGEVAVGVEEDEGGTKAEAAGKDSDQTPEADRRAGSKWAGQTISRYVCGDCSRLLV
jgi:hypothetical protein